MIPPPAKAKAALAKDGRISFHLPTTSKAKPASRVIFQNQEVFIPAQFLKRLCFARISVSKIFAAQVGGSRFRRQTANATNLPQFLAPRVAIETLRGAHSWLKCLYPKFSRPKWAGEGSDNKPRMQRTYHNFRPPAPRSQSCVAPMPC